MIDKSTIIYTIDKYLLIDYPFVVGFNIKEGIG